MIDPKLNELPANTGNTGTSSASDTQAERNRRARAGLSINDTVAGDTLSSVGGRGVDVSGVEAGAGAGSGSTVLTPGVGTSPAPEVLPGGRATGTTPRATSASGRSPAGTAQSDADFPGVTGGSQTTHGEREMFSNEEVERRAYECWCERGCPEGSPEVDWHRAVEDIRQRRRNANQAPRTSTAGA